MNALGISSSDMSKRKQTLTIYQGSVQRSSFVFCVLQLTDLILIMTGGSNQKHCSNSATSSRKDIYAMLAMQDEDPLIFWKNNAKYFPRLALLSRLMLAVATLSASSERAFKELRCVLGNFTRNRLEPKKTASLIHLRTNWVKEME
uniref:HAT C-terminal dimerisation domain-containing protein n=2 Tax=Ditylenchus dipsaci TaxID=166011 RepID=A0A915DTY4_9BILA